MYLGRRLARIRPTFYVVRTCPTSLSSTCRSYSRTSNRASTDVDYAIQSGNALSVHVLFARINPSKSNKFVPAFTESQLIGILQVLGRSGNSEDLALVRAILKDIADVFGVANQTRIHSTIYDTLVSSDDSTAALKWLSKTKSNPGDTYPTVQQWHTWIKRFLQKYNEHEQVLRLLSFMEAVGCSPTVETYQILFTIILRTTRQLTVIKPMIRKLARNLPYDPTIEAIFTKEYVERGLVATAEETVAFYKSMYGLKQRATDQKFNEILLGMFQRKPRHLIPEQLEKMRIQGFTPNDETLAFLLAESVSAQHIMFWEDTLGIKANTVIWARVVRNCADRGRSVDASLEIYNKCISLGLIPDSQLIFPIMRLLCMKTLRPPHERDIDRALALYTEFVRIAPIREPNAAVYNLLISALASAPSKEKYFPVALSLLEEMKSREVFMNSATAASITILLLRTSTDTSEAFQAYKRIRKQPDGKPTLNPDGYVAVLNTFCKLPFNKKAIHIAVPPWEQYFEIVKDMRNAGYPITIKVYSIILQQLGVAATKVREAAGSSEDDGRPDLTQLERAIRKIHQRLILDPEVQPDVIGWNTLMDAYQRAGCLQDALRVWNNLWVSQTFDNASLSIIVDGCGHADAIQQAVEIFYRVRSTKFVLNTHNWNSWLECLCRLGKLNEALKTLCLEMGKDGNAEPDEDSVKTILRFAAETQEEQQVQERIQRYLPKLWYSLNNLTI